RPGSEQVVFEIDSELLRMVAYAFRVHEIEGLRFQVGDALEGVRTLPSASHDVIIRDAFDGENVPAHLVGREMLDEVARVLVADGIYLANVPSEADMKAAEAEGALAASFFKHVALFVDPGQLRGRHFGNVVLAASQQPLPLDELTRRLHRAIAPARVVPVTSL
ncbi:MAG TPA: fused MFS/spermidine synthase, partial [Micromonospora sp.]|nr:fused MFS/spermidine synthase [Micromonospora sp.]